MTLHDVVHSAPFYALLAGRSGQTVGLAGELRPSDISGSTTARPMVRVS
jgi:hypothetical protein